VTQASGTAGLLCDYGWVPGPPLPPLHHSLTSSIKWGCSHGKRRASYTANSQALTAKNRLILLREEVCSLVS
jgi:hypothetical protein